MSASNSDTPPPSRAAVQARAAVVRHIKAEHREFRGAWRAFERLDLASHPEQADALVQRIVTMLRDHGRFEQEHLYPALRAINDDRRAIDRAEVEHESIDALLDRLQDQRCGQDGFAALFEVVCEHAAQHIRHEEAHLLPQLEQAPVDWQAIAGLLEQAQENQAAAPPARPARPARSDQSAPEVPEDARPVPPAAPGEQVPVVHSSPVPLATPADDTLPPDAVRSRPDTPAERRAARRSPPIK